MGIIKLVTSADNIKNSYNSLVEALLTTLNSNGTVKRIFSAWESKNYSTKYQATTDGIVHVMVHVTSGGHETRVMGVTDSNDPPATYKGSAMAVGGNIIGDTWQGFTMAVRKGDFWTTEVNTVGGPTFVFVWWLPIGE